METRTLTCIGCPLGCTLKAELEGNTVRSVTGNTCPNGEKYARKELTAPERILTTTLPILGGDRPTVSVKTAAPVPKGMIFACMEALRGISVSAPVKMGQTLVENLANTGVNLVATRAVEEKVKAFSLGSCAPRSECEVYMTTGGSHTATKWPEGPDVGR